MPTVPPDDPNRTTTQPAAPDPTAEHQPPDETADHLDPDTTGRGGASSSEPFPTHLRAFMNRLGIGSGGSELPDTRSGPPPASGPVRVPGYAVLGELGRGGMGVVYHARQENLNRPVALKMILTDGPVAPGDLVRFLAEAEAVAAVKHPHVVGVYEYGEHDGRPFLALEYCPGGSLAARLKAAARRKKRPGVSAAPFTPAEAADLARKVAEGVAAAHDAGVVHRDLKPGNVLFDEAGEPKVTDFGLAKRAGGAELTRTNAVMGTPAYMAPEQARGGSKFVGPPADVWALGVVLYELLTGRRPFDGDDAWAVLRKVMNDEPSSVRTSAREVPRDLDLICRKCLAKEPHERYPTAKELAADLARFLAGEPVTARPAGATRRLAKWVRRNPAYAALTAGLAAALLAGAAVSVGFAFRADRARAAEAERAAEAGRAQQTAEAALDAERRATALAADRQRQAEAAGDALAGVFRDLDPVAGDVGAPIETRLRDRLVRAVDRLAGTGDPLLVARLQTTLGDALLSLGEAEKAGELADAAAKARAELLGPNDFDTLHALNLLARTVQARGQAAEAVELYRTVYGRASAARGPDDPFTLVVAANLGGAYVDAGQYRSAVPLLEDTVDRFARSLDPAGPHAANALNSLAVAYARSGQSARVIPTYEQAEKRLLVRPGPDAPLTLSVRNNLAVAYQTAGRPQDAVRTYEDVLARRRAVLGPDHPDTLNTEANLARARLDPRRPDRAIAELESLVPRLTARLGPDHHITLVATGNLAYAYKLARRYDAAVPLFERALAGWHARHGPTHADTLIATYNLAGAYFETGQLDRAIPLFQTAYEGRVQVLGWESPDTARAAEALAGMYERAQRWADALAVYEAMLPVYPGLGPAQQQQVPAIQAKVGFLRNRLGRYAEAEQPLRECLEVIETTAAGQWGVFRVKSQLGASLLGQGKADEAGPHLRGGYEGLKARADQIPAPDRRDVLRAALESLVRWAEQTGGVAELPAWRADLRTLTPEPAPPPRPVDRP